jgi:lactate dehydrogenase-like 2-hydroxyacid dehydrogenase
VAQAVATVSELAVSHLFASEFEKETYMESANRKRVGIIGAGRLGQAMARTALRDGRSVVIAKAAALARVPRLLGTIAFVRLRRILQRKTQPAAICVPLAEPIATVQLAAAVRGKRS